MRLFCLLLITIVSVSYGASDKALRKKEQELNVLKGFLQASRDSLQNEIAARWRAKQHFVQQRELDKEELSRLRENQERIHTELARIKEECFARERTLEDERKQLQGKKDEWQFLNASVKEVFEKESDVLLEVFPLDVEKRREDLEALRRDFKKDMNVGNAVNAFFDYRRDYFGIGDSILLTKQTVIPSSGDPQLLTIARFGNVFGYGMNADNDLYAIRQTGNLGTERYLIEKMGTTELSDFLMTTFPKWVEQQHASGPVIVDVLQNAQSSVLLSGKKIKATSRFINFVKAGGPVMVPLFLIVLWALILVVFKLVQFSRKHRADTALSQTIMDFLDNNELEKAKKHVSNRKGVVARVVKTCLEHSKWNRGSAEKAVKEILIDEMPQLSKHLNTLAVIAGAAPLLGLLGTVTGMINLFEVITHYGTGDPKIMAGGISEALVTTQVGLMIAIPILLTHNFLRNRTNDIRAEMEQHAIRILNRLWPEK